MNMQVNVGWQNELRSLAADQRLNIEQAERISARRCNIGDAIFRGDVDRAVEAIESGRSISFVSGWLTGSKTLLMQAIERRPVNWDGMGRVIHALVTRVGMLDDIERGDFLDARDVMGRTAIYLAAKGGDAGTVRALLSLGSDPRIKDYIGILPDHIPGIDPGVRALLESATAAATAARRLKM